MAAAYLLVIGDREALGWVLSEQRTAFRSPARREVRLLDKDDRLFIYATRGCFGKARRSQGKIIGAATVIGPVEALDPPIAFAGREFPVGCGLSVQTLVPFGEGLVLSDIVQDLDAFRDAGAGWPIRLRRALAPITDRDAAVLDKRLAAMAADPGTVIQPYLRWYMPA